MEAKQTEESISCWKCKGQLTPSLTTLVGPVCNTCYLAGTTSSINFPSTTSEARDALEAKVQKVLSVGAECIQESEVRALLASAKKDVVCYDGFEPSGRMHIAQGLIRAINTNKLTSVGFKFKFWVADWFALMNHKLGGDIKKIRNAGLLMIEVWKACGMNMENVEFLWSSDEINGHSNEYWSIVLDIATKFNLTRMKGCTQIMGREESDDLAASQILYPVMQCADIFFLKADICSLGLDQRKVNMLAREYCDKIGRKFKPIILSHHMILGLDGTKMSKSNPDNAIFMDDSPAEVKRKIGKAFCEPKNVEKNPPLEYYKFIVFELQEKVTISRSAENGGDLVFDKWEQLKDTFAAGDLHPADLKGTLITIINGLLAPVQNHFKENAEAKKLLDIVKKYQITK
jgi:tyrosyl-tRNA synthetase